MDGPGGDIIVQAAKRPDVPIPKDTKEMGIFVNIEITGGVEAKDIFITMQYNDSDIPEDFSEKDIKIFYYDNAQSKWIRVSKCGVWANNNTAWARPEHLTVFSPMATKGESSTGTPMIWLYLVLFIIIIILGILIIEEIFGRYITNRLKKRFYILIIFFLILYFLIIVEIMKLI